ncbi:hypothetical protein [Xanthobacter agilis]|uniref:hypothetical protein n=1 Tax=Xanthobacter agilis TaxID=47492 RepID=UPI0037266AAC
MIQIRPVTGTQVHYGFVWLSEATLTRRVHAWVRRRNFAEDGAIFLAHNALPSAAAQHTIFEAVRGLLGEGCDSFGATVIGNSTPDSVPDFGLDLDLQMQINIAGLTAEDEAGFLESCIERYAPRVLIPMDLHSVRIGSHLGGVPMIIGPWIDGFDGHCPGYGLRFWWQTMPDAAPIIFRPTWTEFGLPVDATHRGPTEAFARNYLGLGGAEVEAPKHQKDLIGRLVELDQPTTVLIPVGEDPLEPLRVMKDVRSTCFDFHVRRLRNQFVGGLPVDPFDWPSLAGRWLVYLGPDQNLDELIAAQCRLQGQAYRSAFTLLHGRDGSLA